MNINLCRQMLVPVLLAITHLSSVWSHAIFWEPPSRATLGHLDGNICGVAVNYDHMSLYCGGISVQHQTYGGKCGICGDSFGGPEPHRVPGRFATGIITRSYHRPGQTILVLVDVLADHNGFFAFKLCPNNNPTIDPDQPCFDMHKLSIVANSTTGQAHILHYLHNQQGKRHQGWRVPLEVQLPPNLTCWHCILQWTWVTGNSWGTGPQTAEYFTEECRKLMPAGRLGCGPQETFRGCADICIGPRCPHERCVVAKPPPSDFGQELSSPMPDDYCPSDGLQSTSTHRPVVDDTTFAFEEDNITNEVDLGEADQSEVNLQPEQTAIASSNLTDTVILVDSAVVESINNSAVAEYYGHIATDPEPICYFPTIKEQFYSQKGLRYCIETCLGQPLRLCNLFICLCHLPFSFPS